MTLRKAKVTFPLKLIVKKKSSTNANYLKFVVIE